ncbi:putative zinc finger protein CONSTANS-LIKE 10-like [Capsicum annuum]|nr:putative zinc finger protein CONSTANS-LIKE 10-like [Capsicum annuum]
MNKLEKVLPPGFWDVMDHLSVHLVHEARLGDPVQYRWMYPFESYFVQLYDNDKMFDYFLTWFKDYAYDTRNGQFDQFLKDLSWGPIKMAGGDKDKGTANAPKKKLKKASIINRRLTVSTSHIGISSLPLRGNISEPEIPTIYQSITHGQVYPQADMRDMRNRLIIEPDDYGNKAAKRHCFAVCQDYVFIWLVDHWETDSRFKQMREIGKKARASLKGGSLRTNGAQSQGNVRIKLEKELGRPITQAEAFKTTHTRKKKISEDPDVWVEPRAQLTYQNERIGLDAVSGPSRYGYAYGLPQRTFREFHSKLEGLGCFPNDESRETILDLKQQIVEISSEAKASQAKERQRDIQYAGMKAQFDALLASGDYPLYR